MATLDIASILGIVIGIVLIVFSIVADDGVSAIMGFLDWKSALITYGGALSCLLTMAPNIKVYVKRLSSIKLVMKPMTLNEEENILKIIELANIARKEGLLSVEEAANNVDEEFLRKGILLIVDGSDPELVRNILETELINMELRHKDNYKFWDDMAAMGPAWGMIGTLIGLVNMLRNMGSDAGNIGPSMAVALITTLYGSLLANWIATPVSTKLKENSANEIKMKEVIIEGILSIQAGENPRVIEEKLKSFLAPSARDVITSEGGDNVG